MFTLVNILIALAGLGIGLYVGARKNKRDLEEQGHYDQGGLGELTTYTPNGVILLDGETGQPENITEETDTTDLNPHVEKIRKMYAEATRAYIQKRGS